MKTWFGNKINKKYGWEIAMFYKVRDFSDGIIFFNVIINWDKYLADHSPKFEINIVILNYVIFEFNIYYLYHRN